MRQVLKFLICFAVMLPYVALSQSNVQTFTPSVLLSAGQFEVNQFNNLYSQTATRDDNGDKVLLGERQSFLTSSFSFLYGLSSVNVGLEVNVNTARYTTRSSSMFSIFGGSAADYSRVAVSSIGPRVKFSPLKSVTGLSVQSTFLIPLASNLESPRFVGHDRYTWNTQIFLDRAIGEKTRVFFELGVLYRIKRESQQPNFFRTPMSAIFSYFPTAKSTLYVLGQHAPAFGKLVGNSEEVFGQIRWYTLAAIGGKYQVTPKVGIELSYGSFVLSRADGAGSVLNFGVRIIN